MKFILRYLKPFRIRMTIGLFIKTMGALFELALPYILSYIIDSVVPQNSVNAIIHWGGVMLLCSFGALSFNIIANRMAARVAQDSAEKVRKDLFYRVLHLSSGQVDKVTIPSLEARLTTDTYNVHHFVGMIQRLGVRAPILLTGGLCITWFLDKRLTLVMLGVLPLIGLTIWIVSKSGIPLYSDSQKAVDNMVNIVREDTKGIRVIRSLSRFEDEKDRFNKSNVYLLSREKKASLTMAVSNPLINLLLNLGLTGVVLVGAYLVQDNLSTPGKVIGFIQYFTLISNAMLAVTRLFVQVAKGTASANRIKEIIEIPNDLEVLPSAKTLAVPDIQPYDITFSDVTFSYNGISPQLQNISFSLKTGQKLGLIGSTGCGKTTLLRLLIRFYDPKKGQIYIGGRDIRTYQPKTLRSMFGTVFQNDFIFAGCVYDNINFGRDLTLEEVQYAARTAQAHDYISAYPEGYNHMLSSGGTNVSGGQRQRILLSRALAGNPKILVLDDASSALDYQTDANLRHAIAERYKDTTQIIAAQRVSSVKDCDLILVLEKGIVVGMGNHASLMENCTVYREIADSQMGGVLLDA